MARLSDSKAQRHGATRLRHPAQQDGRSTPSKRGSGAGKRQQGSPAAAEAVSLKEVVAQLRRPTSASAFKFAQGPLKAHLTALAAKHDDALYEVLGYVYAIGLARSDSNVRARMLSGLGVEGTPAKPFLAIFKAIWPGAQGGVGKLLHNRLSSYARALKVAEANDVKPERLAATIRKVGGLTEYAREKRLAHRDARVQKQTSGKAGDQLRAEPAKKVTSPTHTYRPSERKAVSKGRIELKLSNRIEHGILSRGGWAIAVIKVSKNNRSIRVVDMKPCKDKPTL